MQLKSDIKHLHKDWLMDFTGNRVLKGSIKVQAIKTFQNEVPHGN